MAFKTGKIPGVDHPPVRHPGLSGISPATEGFPSSGNDRKEITVPVLPFSGLLYLLLLFLVAVCSGCGYSLHSQANLPFREISIGTIENRTLEPMLQDMLHRALVEELTLQGISIDPSSRRRVSAVIQKFDLPSLSEKGGYAKEYRIILGIDFTFTGEDGKQEVFKNSGSPFIEPVAASDDLGRLLATKRQVEEAAVRDAAKYFVGRLIFK